MVAQTKQQAGGRKRSFRLRPIGYVRTSYCLPEETPAQAPLNPDERGLLIVYPRFAPGLAGVADIEYVKPWEQHLDVPGWPARSVD